MHSLIKLHGSVDPLPESIPLRAGNLSLMYEAGFLRYIRNGGTEIIRMINFLIRDKHWNTSPMEILTEEVQRREAGFTISYTAMCAMHDIQFQWSCRIVGREDETIVFEISGEALHAFEKNRLGFTVLHPMQSTRGKTCLITHGNNTQQEYTFPVLVSPHQPFVDIKTMQLNLTPGISAVLNFEGDLFETEDQRNWNDNSFKTYCTPLTKPRPFPVNKGEHVHQTVQLKVSGDLVVEDDDSDSAVSFSVDHSHLTDFPKIGIPMNGLSHDQDMIDRIKRLDIDFIRIAFNDKATARMEKAVALGLPVEVVLFTGPEFNQAIVKELRRFESSIIQFIVLPSKGKSADKDLLDQVVPILRENFPNATIGSGTDLFFTELNRERTPSALVDFLSFPATPQAHAADYRTIVENLVTHRDVVTSCRSFTDKAIHVGPVTLKTRMNAGGWETEDAKHHTPFPPDADPRQLSLFGAGWTIGSMKHLAESGIQAATYFETCGWRGLMPHPDQAWPSTYGLPKRAVYPVYIIISEILKRKHQRVARLISDDPLSMDGIAFVDDQGRETILLANYTSNTLPIALPQEKAFTSFIFNADNIETYILDSEKEPDYKPQSDFLLLPAFAISILKTS